MRHRLAALLCIAVAACSYDWTVGASAVDGGGSRDAGGDASLPGQDAAPGDGSPQDAQGDGPAPVDCNALETKIQQDLPPALVCTTGSNACMTTVQNECSCTVVLGNSNLNAVGTYNDDVTQFTAAHCPKPVWCPSSCPTVQTGLCVVADATANTDACQQ